MYALICTTPDDDRPTDGVSEFDALFGPIVRRRDEGVVVYESGGNAWDPLIGWDDDAFDSFRESPLGTVVPRSQFIVLLEHVNGFWTDYWLFEDESDLKCLAADISVDVVCCDLYPVACSHLFSNVDGAYWVMVTENQDDIQLVQERWHLTEILEATLIGG